MQTFQIPKFVCELAEQQLGAGKSVTELALELSKHGVTVGSTIRNEISSCMVLELIREREPQSRFESNFETAFLVTKVQL